MLVRIRDTGEVLSDDEFRRLHANTSFPSTLTDENLDDFGADPVFDGVQPVVTDNQYLTFDGAEELNGQWFTKWLVIDYTPEEITQRLEQWRQSASCTPFQGRMALSDAGLLSNVEAAVAGADEKTKVAWEYALVWERNSPMFIALMSALGVTDNEADDLMKAASQITA